MWTRWNFESIFLKIVHQKGLFDAIKKNPNFPNCRGILHIYWQWLLKSYKECDMSLRDVQTIHVTNMLAWDSVILLLSAIKMVNTDLFTSSLVHFRRPVEPKKCFMLSRIVMFVKKPSLCCSDRFISFGKYCWMEDFEDDYFEQKIGIIPHLRPLDLQGELISIEFYLIGC